MVSDEAIAGIVSGREDLKGVCEGVHRSMRQTVTAGKDNIGVVLFRPTQDEVKEW